MLDGVVVVVIFTPVSWEKGPRQSADFKRKALILSGHKTYLGYWYSEIQSQRSCCCLVGHMANGTRFPFSYYSDCSVSCGCLIISAQGRLHAFHNELDVPVSREAFWAIWSFCKNILSSYVFKFLEGRGRYSFDNINCDDDSKGHQNDIFNIYLVLTLSQAFFYKLYLSESILSSQPT